MAAYTKNTPGAPTAGFFAAGDTVTDSLGTVHTALRTGYAGIEIAYGPGLFSSTYSNLGATSAGIGASASAFVTAAEFGAGGLHQTVLTVSALPQTITNGASEFTGTKIYDFPEGRIHVLGCVATLAQTTTSTLASTITTGTAGAVSLGTVVASNASLTGTMVDLAPSTAFSSSTVINVAGTAVSPILAAAAVFATGITTPIDMFLNTSIATNTNDGTMTWSGTIRVTWINLGDA